MIEVKNISFNYDAHDGATVHALNDVSLTVEEGENIGLIGANSSGKTTLARCLDALHLPSSGTVIVDGLATTDYGNHTKIRRRVGMVFQNPDNQIVSATVEREIAFGLENLGVPTEEMHEIVSRTLEKFDLEKYRTSPPHLLSGGEKQRLALAAVMAMNPKYLILDEPTSMLDPRGRDSIIELITNIHVENKNKEKRNRIATILITQFPEEMLSVQRLLVMDKGRIVMDDTPDVIFRRIDELHELGLEPPIEYELDRVLDKLRNKKA